MQMLWSDLFTINESQCCCKLWRHLTVLHEALWHYMWRHLRKPALWRDKYHIPCSDAATNARRLIRAYDICRLWTSIVNIFVPPCSVSAMNIISNVWKQLIKEDTVCSSVRQVFADDVTYVNIGLRDTFFVIRLCWIFILTWHVTSPL